MNTFEFKEAVKKLIECLPSCADCGAPALYLKIYDDDDMIAFNFCERCMPESLKEDYETGYTRALKNVMEMLENDEYDRARQKMEDTRKRY